VEQVVTRLGKVLIASATFTLLMPAAVGAIMLNGPAEIADEAQVRVVPSKPQLGTLGRASAVAWLSAGHVSAVP